MIKFIKLKTKSIISLTLVVSLFLISCPLFAQEGIAEAEHWAQVDLWELGIQGIIDLEDLDPTSYITRAQFTAMLIKSLGLDTQVQYLDGAPLDFRDIPAQHPYRKYIALALEKALVAGYSENTFKPDEQLRRDQMIVLLVRLMDLGKTKAENKYLAFIDKSEIPDYARPAISTGVRLGLVAGYTDQSFRPAQKITLAEGAAFINRWRELMGDRYDYSGILQKLKDANKLEMIIDDQVVAFPVNKQAYFIQKGKLGSINNLTPGNQVNIKLNTQGKVILAHEKDISLTQMPLIIEEINLPTINTNEQWPQVASLFTPRLPLDQHSIADSLQVGQAEINMPALLKATDSTGAGQIIAIIDTGVDPSHPDLARTSEGRPKIMDWVDFTLEGLVNMHPVTKGQDGALVWEDQKYPVGDIPSRSGQYRLGFLDLNGFAPIELVNRYQSAEVAVLLTDAVEKGVYDTVYIDTNNDQCFAEEKALKLFKKGQSYISLNYAQNSLALAVTDVDAQGRYVQLANDVSGHGTHVAGIIGAHGGLQGVAPGAQIMVLKAVDRDGFADPQNIMEAMRYAALHGADIINISLGQYQQMSFGDSEIAQLTNELTQKYNTIIVSAAGNIGPGLSSTASPADADRTISVGAFVSPAMWRTDFGYQVPQESLYFFSSTGPRKDGAWYPNLIAPGSAVSTVPLWMGHDYLLAEGTSMAAPFVSGLVAHLLENAQQKNIPMTPALVKKALEEGADYMEHLEIAEQGHGVLNAHQAWQMLEKLEGEQKLKAEIYNPQYSLGAGLLAREYLPAQLNLKITNNDAHDYSLSWRSSASWLKIGHQKTFLSAKSTREIPLMFDLPDEPGLYSAILEGDDPQSPGSDILIPVHIIVGTQIENEPSGQAVYLDQLGPAQLARYFLTVPEGVTGLNAQLEIFPDTSGIYRGRARLHLINPFGMEIKSSDYVGENIGIVGKKGLAEAIEFFPEAGTWEIVVYSSAALSEFNLKESKYQLTLQIGQILDFDEDIDSDLDLTLAPIAQKALDKSSGKIILHLWDNQQQKPYQGFLKINGRLYQIENGRVEYLIDRS